MVVVFGACLPSHNQQSCNVLGSFQLLRFRMHYESAGLLSANLTMLRFDSGKNSHSSELLLHELAEVQQEFHLLACPFFLSALMPALIWAWKFWVSAFGPSLPIIVSHFLRASETAP